MVNLKLFTYPLLKFTFCSAKTGGIMGFYDRDYYREWWAKKEGYVEKSPMRMNLGQANKPKKWHPILIVLLLFFSCTFAYVGLKMFDFL